MTAEMEHEDFIPTGMELRPAPPAESPFSLNWRMVDGNGCDVQITMRAGVNREVIAEVMGNRKAFVDLSQKAGWTFGPKSQAAPSATLQATTSGASVPYMANGSQWKAPAPNGPVAGGGFASKPRESFVAVKMDVVPRPDGKVNINLFAAGHQFPDIYMTKTPAEAAAALAKCGPWDAAEHFSAAASYEGLNYVVEYTLSDKKNSKGNPYKDLADIRPA